jgi:uncharacterized protein (DUF58 family)
MIVPRTRLLVAFACVVLPLALLAAFTPESALLAGLGIGLFAAAALADAVLACGVLRGIHVALPELVRWTKDRAAVLELNIHNPKKTERRLRIGLAWPREIASEDFEKTAVLPPGHAQSRLSWPCVPLWRGRYYFQQCHIEGASPYGFWAIRKSLPIRCEMRVYPNLLGDRKTVASIFLNRGTLGTHALRQLGKGREFEKLRDYIPGDSFEDVHWKATAKRGSPVTKVFQIERTQEIYVIVDSSRLTARSVPREGAGLIPDKAEEELHFQTTILERFINSALVLGLAAEQQGDLFGLLSFSDRVQNFLRAKSGKAHYGACRDAIYSLQPQIVSPDFDELCSFLRVRLRRRALLFFLTALDDPVVAESFLHNMELLSRQHLVVVAMMNPPGARALFSNAEVHSVQDIYGRLSGHLLWHNLRELQTRLQHRGAHFSLLDNERMSAQLVGQYLSLKQRQML